MKVQKTHIPKPDQKPPVSTLGVPGWIRKNLFSSIPNTILTIVVAWIAFYLLSGLISWAFIDANWVGTTRDACTGSGACWVFVHQHIEQFVFGFYPENQLWRIELLYALLFTLIILLVVERVPYKRWISGFTLIVFPILAFELLRGGSFGLEGVDTGRWGGLTLTLVLALVGIAASLPLGILLALGRRSDMPIVRRFSVVYIEFWRGVPLITVLFMASVMLPLFMPNGMEVNKLLRALIGISLFQASYIAEVVRGGLQAIPRGQYEAAEALGLTYWKSMVFIILPQALKMMIPGIVNTFIELFKDTSLVLIIGLFDLLNIVQASLADPKWLGFSIEGYVFAASVYFLFCFAMSRYSQHLEYKLNTGHR